MLALQPLALLHDSAVCIAASVLERKLLPLLHLDHRAYMGGDGSYNLLAAVGMAVCIATSILQRKLLPFVLTLLAHAGRS